ncbi:MAG: nucleotide exchange factor GrpE, partial [Clostridia bacterium]|nr:nucleotide exchange factor GrpE [Clostridia bacterium]
ADTMEAIMAMPAADGEESGIVKQVYLKGYKKGDKVLRYAQVIVTQ